eukprot:6906137-Prymnesium_polylepis.2
MHAVSASLRTQLKLPKEESLVRAPKTCCASAPSPISSVKRRLAARATQFLYCNQSFAPAPDATIGDVALCFHSNDGVLILNYCLSPAWG